MGPISDRLAYVSNGLIRWFNRIRQEKTITLSSLQNRLNQLSVFPPTDDVLRELGDVRLVMNIEMDKYEIYWEQKARAN